jgi:predicted methyltransferase
MHGLHRDKVLTEHLRSFAAALKPGGRLCVVQHRAKEEANPDESAQQGYLPQAWVIEQVKAAGFDFVAASEINANPKDTKDYEGGVWTLPPVLAEGDKDKAKYEAIGESDRMTLLFTKSAKK